MEVETEICVDADAEVIVHEEYRRRVLVSVGGVQCVGKNELHLVRLLLVGVEDNRPSGIQIRNVLIHFSLSCTCTSIL